MNFLCAQRLCVDYRSFLCEQLVRVEINAKIVDWLGPSTHYAPVHAYIDTQLSLATLQLNMMIAFV